MKKRNINSWPLQKGRKNLKTHVKYTVPWHRHTKKPRPNCRIYNTSLPPISHHITNILSKEVSFTQYVMSSCRENYKAYQKAKFEETKQASEPDTARILELSDWQFKTTIMNMLKALMDKIDNV